MTASTHGKIERTPTRPTQLRDLSDPKVRDQIFEDARTDAKSSLLRNRRAGIRGR
jgi:hypothetical protein